MEGAQKVNKKKRRSAKACNACHASKVRCDIAVTGPPCNRCRKRGINDCSTFPSRRGTYDRKEWQKKQQKQEETQRSEESEQPRSNAATMVTKSASISPSSSVTTYDINNGESWECVMEYFLQKKKSKIPKNSLTFLGESSPLTTLLRKLKSSGHIQINGLDDANSSSGHIDTEMRILDQKGCFNLPKKSALETLFRNYFTNVHPFNPIINRVWFANRYKESKLSYLLTHSVCFATCYHCPLSAIYEAGFSSRIQAKYSFYLKAKTLFDCNYEKDKLVALQACFLLSFWAGKPNDVWNTRTWLGVAFTIAEDLGMHRSTGNTEISASDKSHLRIMWWCLCNRDIMTSLTFGRPPKVSLERCDVEKLVLDDFDKADADYPGDPMFGHHEIAHSYYHMEVSKLTRMLHHVFMARCDPRAPRSSALNTSQYQQLLTWRSELPPDVDWEIHKDSIFAICLRILYHHQILYIFRPSTSDSTAAEDCCLDRSLESASEIALAASKLSMMSMMSVPQDVYGSFFMAMVILAMDSRSKISANPEASAMQLQICKMALSQGEGNWDHSQWVIKIFDRLMDQEKQEPYSANHNNNSSSPDQITLENNQPTGIDPSMAENSTDSNIYTDPTLDTSMQSLTDFCVPEYSDLFKVIFGNGNENI